MKKLFLFSALTMICVNTASGADISSSATTAQCVEPTLHRYEGTANLQAEWEANTVPLRWYNNNTMIPSTDAIDDCQYSGSLTTPTNPSRTGYTFKGWTVSPKVEFSSLELGNADGASYGKGVYDNEDYCYYFDTTDHASTDICKMAEFTDLQQFEWKQSFANGTVYGMAHCTAMSGNNYSVTWPTTKRSDYTASLDTMNIYDTQHGTEEKKYCWCQATGYKPTNQSTIQRPLSNLTWIFYGNRGNLASCTKYCATHCARYIYGTLTFRTALFTPAN